MQFDPINTTLKPNGTKRLRLKCDILLSTSAFRFNVRRYIESDPEPAPYQPPEHPALKVGPGRHCKATIFTSLHHVWHHARLADSNPWIQWGRADDAVRLDCHMVTLASPSEVQQIRYHVRWGDILQISLVGTMYEGLADIADHVI